jgi:hypothetical protein
VEWAIENGMKINPSKSKAVRFTRSRVKNALGYSLGDPKIPESNISKYLGIILRSGLNWLNQVNYLAQKAWNAFHFVMRVLKKGNGNTKKLTYTSLVCPILEYEAACWDPCRGGQTNALDRVQTKTAQFTNHEKDSDWETLAQCRTKVLMRTFFSVL